MLRRGISIFVVLLALLAATMPVWATVVGPHSVFDNFDEVVVKDPSNTSDVPYWWIIQNGDLGQYYASCGDASCVTAMQEHHTTFARLQLQPDATPNDFISSEISELRTGYSYGQGRWLPTPGHPVIATARVRFSPSYHVDGSGGAVGSAGFWLYNSYIDFPNQTIQPIKSLGFGWGEQGTSGGALEGLRTMVLQDSVPVYNNPVNPEVDMSDWMMWQMIWSATRNGKQEVLFLVNGWPAGHVVLQDPLPALSITFWSDNQFATFLDGSLSVEYHNPSANQNFDIDWVRVNQP